MSGPHQKLKIGLVADELTAECLQYECDVIQLHPVGFTDQIRDRKLDFVLVESAWQASGGAWNGKIASPKTNSLRTKLLALFSKSDLRKLTYFCSKSRVPAIFWNKEDSVHFQRFIQSAKLFEYIYTVDSNAINSYRSKVPGARVIDSLPFCIQPKIHFPKRPWSNPRVNFVGSFSSKIHSDRKKWQEVCFQSAEGIGIDVYDRNSGRPSPNYRFPGYSNLTVNPAVPHAKTADIFNNYVASINVNTIVDSPTMFSRRLIEIMACGGLAITNNALSVAKFFADYVHSTDNHEELSSIFEGLRNGRSKIQEEMALAGSQYVKSEFTYSSFLNKIIGNIDYGRLGRK